MTLPLLMLRVGADGGKRGDKCRGGGGGGGVDDGSGTTRKIIKYRSYFFYLAPANIVAVRSDKLRLPRRVSRVRVSVVLVLCSCSR